MTTGSDRQQPAGGLMPHPVLGRYYPQERERRAFLDQMFDSTARDYDRIEKLIGFGQGAAYRHRALLRAGLAPGMRVIDVGIGTGLVAREAVRIVGDPTLVTGVDPSVGMLSQARLPAGVTLLQGKGESIPLPAASGDFLSMGFALRHLSSLDSAFAEFFRVLRPGARLCLLELTRAPGPVSNALLKLYMKRVVPLVARVLTRDAQTMRIWRYYWDTIEACVAPEVVLQALRDAGFVDVQRCVEVGIFTEYQARRP